jgi:hypothetical protein
MRVGWYRHHALIPSRLENRITTVPGSQRCQYRALFRIHNVGCTHPDPYVLGLPDPHPYLLVTSKDPDPALDQDPMC